LGEVKLQKSGLQAFVRIKDKSAESTTFEIIFSKPVIKSILDLLAVEKFGKANFSTSEYHITVKLKETEYKKCFDMLDAFLMELDGKLSEAYSSLRFLKSNVGGKK
jgi:hypothetical protein